MIYRVRQWTSLAWREEIADADQLRDSQENLARVAKVATRILCDKCPEYKPIVSTAMLDDGTPQLVFELTMEFVHDFEDESSAEGKAGYWIGRVSRALNKAGGSLPMGKREVERVDG